MASDESTERKFSVVIVDDVADLRGLIRHVLEWSGRFEVIGEGENGREAIDLAGSHSPDLILLDISMPVMGGLEALPLLLDVSPATKVVMLSGFEADRLGQQTLELGAAAYLEKGVSPANLVKTLLEVLTAGNGEGVASPGDADFDRAAPLTDLSSEDMMSLVAHEIRNPLAVIQGFGNELQSRWDTMEDEQRLDAVRRMTERARYLNTIVSNLMYMRKVGSDEARPNLVEHEVESLIAGMRDELRDLSRGHPVEFYVEEGLPPVMVDLARLRQVLTNLVVNAAKFAPKETPITISARLEGDGVSIDVADQGPGIPEDKREVVFEKFKRLERGGSGIGLGLFISRALMRSMGGGLSVQGGPGASLRCRLRTASQPS